MKLVFATRTSLARVAAALAAVAAVAVTAAAPTLASPGTAPCSPGSLVVWLDTQGSGAAGSSFYDLELTNLSRHACHLRGYPGVSAIDLAGAQVGRAASRDAAHPASRVTLSAGGSAHAVVRIVDAGNYPRSACRQTTAAGLRVYPPGQRASKVVPFPFAACARSAPNILSVEAVQAGFAAAR